jgi:3-hydroxyisobutyrate dehydrogenase
MKPSVGFIGLGLMGGPMARNLLRAGFPVTVWNRTRSKAEALVPDGAKLAASPEDVAAEADVLITIVSDPPALEEVLFGADNKGPGALSRLRPGTLLIDCSTVSPSLERQVSAACAKRSIAFLDAPVTGGTWGAEKGELVFMVGGKAEVLERAVPLLEAMGKKWFLLGDVGAGQTVKLAMNLLLALNIDALAEAMALVTSSGLAAERLVEVLQSSMGRSAMYDVKAPLMLKGEFIPASFPLRLMQKDLTLALELARENNTTLPTAKAAWTTYTKVMDTSKDDPDFSSVTRFWEKTIYGPAAD